MTCNLVEIFRGISVLVVGDVMLDEYLIGSVARISPEAPVPVVDVQSRKCVLGGAANVAANIASLGGIPLVFGAAAYDKAGEELRGLFHKAGISAAGLMDSGKRCTVSKTRIVAGQQQIVRIDQESREVFAQDLSSAVVGSARAAMPDARVVVLSDYGKGLLSETVCPVLIEAGRQLDLTVIVDPKGRDFEKYRGCSIITPNLAEAAAASGITVDSDQALYRAGEYLLRMLPGTSVLVTRGEDGMILFTDSGDPVTVPTVARHVFDVVGAGDTAVAALALSMGAGIALPRAMKIANLAAGAAVGKQGTATVTVSELFDQNASVW
jgi:D-beta-D-heptose 7-phosphate kinase/D-beta-D-heptose 1-phosphate adenosyltransferase